MNLEISAPESATTRRTAATPFRGRLPNALVLDGALSPLDIALCAWLSTYADRMADGARHPYRPHPTSACRALHCGRDAYYASMRRLIARGVLACDSYGETTADRAAGHVTGDGFTRSTARWTLPCPLHGFGLPRRDEIETAAEQVDRPEGAAFVLYADALGRPFYPREIEVWSRLSKRVAGRILRALVDAGLLLKRDERRGGRYAGTRYAAPRIGFQDAISRPGNAGVKPTVDFQDAWRASPDASPPDASPPDARIQDAYIKDSRFSEDSRFPDDSRSVAPPARVRANPGNGGATDRSPPSAVESGYQNKISSVQSPTTRTERLAVLESRLGRPLTQDELVARARTQIANLPSRQAMLDLARKSVVPAKAVESVLRNLRDNVARVHTVCNEPTLAGLLGARMRIAASNLRDVEVRLGRRLTRDERGWLVFTRGSQFSPMTIGNDDLLCSPFTPDEAWTYSLASEPLPEFTPAAEPNASRSCPPDSAEPTLAAAHGPSPDDLPAGVNFRTPDELAVVIELCARGLPSNVPFLNPFDLDWDGDPEGVRARLLAHAMRSKIVVAAPAETSPPAFETDAEGAGRSCEDAAMAIGPDCFDPAIGLETPPDWGTPPCGLEDERDAQQTTLAPEWQAGLHVRFRIDAHGERYPLEAVQGLRISYNVDNDAAAVDSLNAPNNLNSC